MANRDAKTAVTNFKAKYQGAYDKYTDSEILDALKKKYPNAYNDLTLLNEIPKTENILSRAVKAGTSALSSGFKNMSPLGVKANPSFPFLPQMPTDSPALSEGISEASMPITKGNPWGDVGIQGTAGLLSGGVLAGPSLARGANAARKGFINFGGKKAARGISQEIGNEMSNVQGGFNKMYEPILELDTSLPHDLPMTLKQGVPENLMDDLVNTISQASEGSPNPQVFQKLSQTVQNMNPEQLHNLKAKLWNWSGEGIDEFSMGQIREKLGEILSHPDVFGEPYAKATATAKPYLSGERPYLRKMTQDPFGKPTEGKFKTTTDLASNEEAALKGFSERTGKNFFQRVKAVKRGQKVKKAAKKIAPIALGYGAYEILH